MRCSFSLAGFVWPSTDIGVGHFSLSVGSFSVGLRTQRTSSDPKLIVGMLLHAENRVTHWSYDMDPGDVLVIPPSIDHDGRFRGASSYAALRLDLADVAGVFQGESWMSDPANWRRRNRYRADPRVGAEAVTKLRAIVARLIRGARVTGGRRLLATGDHRCPHRVRHAFATAHDRTGPVGDPVNAECRALY